MHKDTDVVYEEVWNDAGIAPDNGASPATVENGILKIYLPKAAVGRRKVIRLGQSA